MRATVNVTAGGKVTIPKPIRQQLDIGEGDTVEIDVTVVSDDG
jgi:AbrB family looped-hinge helix DNA binding protein